MTLPAVGSEKRRKSGPQRGKLLGRGDPQPVNLFNAGGRSPFLLTGDHAGNRIPASLGDLGVSAADRERHIGWDIGVRGLGKRLAGLLDAAFIHQEYSRLVIDCNRDPGAPDAIPEMSDGTPIPGNQGLSGPDREARLDAIHRPYQQGIGELIASREAAEIETILVALHSFTPALGGGNPRPWQVGVLHWRGNTAFARRLLQLLAEPGDLVVGDNQPYQMDGIDHSVPLHAFDRGLPYAELEIRQDLIGNAAGQDIWAVRIADALRAAA